ncbi:MAG: ATP-binding protein [Aliiglaciecola sp.]
MRSEIAMTKNLLAAHVAYESIQQAADEGTPAMGMLSGKAGLGKTTAGAWLFVNAEGVLIRCLKADTLSTFLERLALELGLETRQRRADMINFIVRELAMTGKPLFIDEADYLASNTEVLETIRDIYDLSNVPIILIGYEQLPIKVKRLPQLYSRISQHVEFKPADEDDITTMAEQLVENTQVEHDLLGSLLEKSKGNFRRITVGLGTIEKFAKSNSLSSINLEQFADRDFFPRTEL